MIDLKAGIFFSTQFVEPGSKKYKGFIDYINRNESKENETLSFATYNDYMGNEYKSNTLFTKEKDYISKEEASQIKDIFKAAQENGSLMWQSLISFDEEFIKEVGLLKDGFLDDERLKELTRESMDAMLEKENINTGAFWSAAIHRNTDNIHVHIATVELTPTRERGKFKFSSIKKGKGKIASNLINRSPSHERIQELTRNNILKDKRDYSYIDGNRQERAMFLNIYKKLPTNKSLWKYNMNALGDIRNDIDSLTSHYLEHYKQDEFKELKSLLKKEEELYKKIYGGEKANDYSQNKIDDLYSRVGNSILKECLVYNQKLFEEEKKKFNKRQAAIKSLRNRAIINSSLKKINYYMSNELEKARSMNVYERLQAEIAAER